MYSRSGGGAAAAAASAAAVSPHVRDVHARRHVRAVVAATTPRPQPRRHPVVAEPRRPLGRAEVAELRTCRGHGEEVGRSRCGVADLALLLAGEVREPASMAAAGTSERAAELVLPRLGTRPRPSDKAAAASHGHVLERAARRRHVVVKGAGLAGEAGRRGEERSCGGSGRSPERPRQCHRQSGANSEPHRGPARRRAAL